MSTVNYENACMYMSKINSSEITNSWRRKTYRKLTEAANFDQFEQCHFEVGTQLR
jgi:tellurite resistance protein